MCNKIKLHLELTVRMGQSVRSKTGYIDLFTYIEQKPEIDPFHVPSSFL